MQNEQKSGSLHISMLEIIMVLGIFVIVSVFLLRLFLTANSLQKKAVNTSKAVIQAETVAEILKTEESMAIALLGMDIKVKKNNTYVLYFDKNWKKVDKSPTHKIKVTLQKQSTKNGIMEKADISVSEGLCNLTVKRYQNIKAGKK